LRLTYLGVARLSSDLSVAGQIQTLTRLSTSSASLWTSTEGTPNSWKIWM